MFLFHLPLGYDLPDLGDCMELPKVLVNGDSCNKLVRVGQTESRSIHAVLRHAYQDEKHEFCCEKEMKKSIKRSNLKLLSMS